MVNEHSNSPEPTEPESIESTDVSLSADGDAGANGDAGAEGPDQEPTTSPSVGDPAVPSPAAPSTDAPEVTETAATAVEAEVESGFDPNPMADAMSDPVSTEPVSTEPVGDFATADISVPAVEVSANDAGANDAGANDGDINIPEGKIDGETSPESTADPGAEPTEAVTETSTVDDDWGDGLEDSAEDGAAAAPSDHDGIADTAAEDVSPDDIPSVPPTAPPTAPPTPAPAPAASSESSVDPSFLKIATIVTLTTIIQGGDTAKTLLNAAQVPVPSDTNEGPSIPVTIWRTLKPILLKVLLAGVTLFRGVTSWTLARVDGAAQAAVEEGSAPFLRDRIQSTTIGQRIWDILETLWGIWVGVITFVRDRFFPDPLSAWSIPSITAVLGTIVVFFFWISASLAPAPAAVPAIESPSAQPTALTPQTPAPAEPTRINNRRDESLATSLQTQFLDDVGSRYGSDVVHQVQVDRLHDRLIVSVGQDWYDLSDRRQQRLANVLLDSTADAKFGQLTLVNLAGVRIARSPVVGSDMVLFQSDRPEIVIPEPVVEEVVEEPEIDSLDTTTPETEAIAVPDELDAITDDSPLNADISTAAPADSNPSLMADETELDPSETDSVL